MASPRREAKKAREQAAREARLAAQRRRRQTKTIAVAIVIALIVGSLGLLATVNSDDQEAADTTTTTAVPADTPCPATDGSSPRTTSFGKAPQMCIDAAKTYKATFDTTEGKIVVDLDTKATPSTTNNFVVLARYHYYDNTAIFRTDPSIDIIQGGSPTTQDNTDPGPGYNIQDEGTPFTYAEGDLVMANSGSPNTSGAQYFFGTGPNIANLDAQGTYLKFGKVSEGLDVLDKIMALHTPSGSLGGKPSKSVVVNTVTISES